MRASCWMFVLLTATAFADDNRFEQTVAADPQGAVEISNVSGSVTVTGWDQPQVGVTALLDNPAMKVQVTSEHGRTLVSIGHAGMSMSGGDARLTVRVPQGGELDATTVSAKLSTSGIRGPQRLKTVSGEIVADVGAGDAEVKTVSGDIRLRGAGIPGSLRIDSVSGDVNLEHGAGDVEATTISGDLHINDDPARSVRLRTTSGDLNFRGTLQRNALLESESIKGDIQVHAPSEDGFAYEVSSFSGDIKDCFGQGSERASAYGPGHRLSGTRGNGSAHIRLKSLSGDVELCDHK
jgi:DUF4097 and DUF4098 domain-containing protein YvlB